MHNNHNWVVVLAAGEGTRLSALTADDAGRHVPKQFCSLHGGQSLFGLALTRARAIVPEERVCAVVATDHERWWQQTHHEMHPGNMIVQPRNRGTGNGVLLALAYIPGLRFWSPLLVSTLNFAVLDVTSIIGLINDILPL